MPVNTENNTVLLPAGFMCLENLSKKKKKKACHSAASAKICDMWHDKTLIAVHIFSPAYALFRARQLLGEVAKIVASTWNYKIDRWLDSPTL